MVRPLSQWEAEQRQKAIREQRSRVLLYILCIAALALIIGTARMLGYF